MEGRKGVEGVEPTGEHVSILVKGVSADANDGSAVAWGGEGDRRGLEWGGGEGDCLDRLELLLLLLLLLPAFAVLLLLAALTPSAAPPPPAAPSPPSSASMCALANDRLVDESRGRAGAREWRHSLTKTLL
jgi:hypothetical protein